MAYVFFKRRPLVSAEPDPIAVTITGTGNTSRCYVTINGTTYTAAASGIEVSTGDIITFAVKATINAAMPYTYVSIDGEKVVSASVNSRLYTYEWTVPEGVTEVSIALTYQSGRYGYIDVTTS